MPRNQVSIEELRCRVRIEETAYHDVVDDGRETPYQAEKDMVQSI